MLLLCLVIFPMFGIKVDFNTMLRSAREVTHWTSVQSGCIIEIVLLFKLHNRFRVEVATGLPGIMIMGEPFPMDEVLSIPYLPSAVQDSFYPEFLLPLASPCVCQHAPQLAYIRSLDVDI